jgi:hypothetical protein
MLSDVDLLRCRRRTERVKKLPLLLIAVASGKWGASLVARSASAALS